MKHIHFIAIGGAVMHQLALALKRQENIVTGSDDEINDPAKSNLAAAGILPDAVASKIIENAGVDRMFALHSAIDAVRRGGTISVIGVYAGKVDPMPMDTLFDKQIQMRMGQANVKRWVDDIMPLLTDADPLGVDSFATHHLSLSEAPEAYENFQKKQDGAIKIVLKP